MARLFLAAFVLIVVCVSHAEAQPALPECCACKKSLEQAPLYCVLVPPGDFSSADSQCQEAGGEALLCEKTLPGVACTFEGLHCPASPAPALSDPPLAALALLLGTIGFVTVRRRARAGDAVPLTRNTVTACTGDPQSAH
jgi:hypothetical protein